MKTEISNGATIETVPDIKLKARLHQLLIKILSLKFLSFAVQVVLGIIWFQALLSTGEWNVGLWGVWVGYIVGAFTVYTAGNVKTKQVYSSRETSLPVISGGDER